MKKLLLSFLVLAAMSAAVIVFAEISRSTENFRQAEDFPRDALIYVQIRDLPALVKLWKDSSTSQKYLESTNFKDFKNNHLALKLIERAGEIFGETGLFPDLGFVSGLSENRAALAVYDVGRMEFVFIAPMSEEKILASQLFAQQSSFEEIQIDETTAFVREMEVDRARQRQKIIFGNFQGRLILATSEKYFLQTLANIKGKTPKNRLSSEPLFQEVAGKTTPNLATVWLNQQKLNNDWYFRHYWLMSEVEALKNLRAGMFDLALEDEKITERRVFSTSNNNAPARINSATAARLGRMIPETAALYKIRTANEIDFATDISDVLFDANRYSEKRENGSSKKNYYFRDWEKSYSYSYLDDDFSEQIDENEDDETMPGKISEDEKSELNGLITTANPNVSLKMFSPQVLDGPLFFENRKALIFSLQNPAALNRKALETALSRKAQSLLTVGRQADEFLWSDVTVENIAARKLAIPALGWQIFYAVRQNELIFCGSEDFLEEILTTVGKTPPTAGNFDEFAVIDLKNGRRAFEDVFATLDKLNAESEDSFGTTFFSSNIGSLLEVASDVRKIEIKRRTEKNFLFEEIDFVFEKKGE